VLHGQPGVDKTARTGSRDLKAWLAAVEADVFAKLGITLHIRSPAPQN
jgi:hypothetical protein